MKPTAITQMLTIAVSGFHRLTVVSAGLTVLLVGLVLTGCSRQDDERSIRNLIAEGAKHAEAHDIAGILALTTPDVLASPMDLNRRALKGFLWRTFSTYGAFTILYPRPSVDVQIDAGQAWAQVAFVIVKKAQVMPNLDQLRDDPLAWIDAVGKMADLHQLRLQLIKSKGSWRVDRAFLENATDSGFN